MKYIIEGRKFANEPSYYDWDKEHRYADFKIVDEVVIALEADGLDEAYKWMLENVPTYAIGCSIRSVDGKSFLLNPVKGYYSCIGLPDLKDETIVAAELERVIQRM